MIRCYMDGVPADSKCAKCCVYCEEKCDFVCELSELCETEQNVIKADCAFAFEEE